MDMYHLFVVVYIKRRTGWFDAQNVWVFSEDENIIPNDDTVREIFANIMQDAPEVDIHDIKHVGYYPEC